MDGGGYGGRVMSRAVSERRRRVTWLIHNTLTTPFIPIRMGLLLVIRLGEGAEWVGLRTPGWRMYDGWKGW